MLQQIIEDMYIDPDLLAELSEDQKQLIFLKIREEQIRRYNEWSDKVVKAKKEIKKNPKKVGPKTVQWLLGSDDKPWTWVMGDHKRDKTIEQIIEEEQRKAASAAAELEAQKLRLKEDTEMKLNVEKEQKKLEEERKRKEEELAKIKASADVERNAAAERRRLAKEKADSELRINEERKKQEEARAARLTQESEQTKRKLDTLKERFSSNQETSEKARLKREESYHQLKQKRESEILSGFHKTRAMFESNSAAESVKIDSAWKISEEKAKQADKERRSLVQSAREDFKRNLKHGSRSSVSYNTSSNNNAGVQTRNKNCAIDKERTTYRESTVLMTQVNEAARVLRKKPSFHKARPKTRIMVKDWFITDQKPRKVGLKSNGAVEPWFHGIISREDAEKLLQTKPVHSYLVRVSEKIFGFAISYKSAERIKHYLVDIEDENYQFFGTNQLEHKSLKDLVHYHKDQPVSSAGKELLMFPVGQITAPPDYTELYPELVESTSL